MSNTRVAYDGSAVPATQISGVYPGPYNGAQSGGRRGVKAKTLKKLLKKAGLKTSGKKSTLRARAKKARLIRGGYLEGQSHIEGAEVGAPVGGRSRRRSFRKFW
jgi:hypothetical protein